MPLQPIDPSHIGKAFSDGRAYRDNVVPLHDRTRDPVWEIRDRLNKIPPVKHSVNEPPRWLNTACKVCIVLAGVVSVALWWLP
jgi:hypothetical protein